MHLIPYLLLLLALLARWEAIAQVSAPDFPRSAYPFDYKRDQLPETRNATSLLALREQDEANQISIEGYNGNIGDASANKKRSEQKATSVADALTAKGSAPAWLLPAGVLKNPWRITVPKKVGPKPLAGAGKEVMSTGYPA